MGTQRSVWAGLVAGVLLGWALVLSGAGTAGAAQKVSIRYWDFIDPKAPNPRGRGLAQILENFKKRHPDIEVTVEIIPWSQLEMLTIQAAAAGKTADVIRMQLPLLGQAVEAGAVLALDRYTSALGKEFRDDFIVDWNGTAWNGQKMAIPYEHRAGVLYYREDILQKLGLGVPRTMDDLIKAGKVLADNNLGGFVVGLSRNEQAFAFLEWFIPMLWSAGGELLTPDGKAAFNSPAGVQAAQLVSDLINKHKAMPRAALNYAYEAVFQGVKAGTIALNSLGSHRVVAARDAGQLQGKLKTAPMPGLRRDKPAPPHVVGWALAMGKDTKAPDAAWSFIEHMVSTESQVINARVAGELPARKSAFNDPWFKSPEAAEMNLWKDYIYQHGRVQRYRGSPVELWQGMADAVAEVVIRGRSAKEALDEAATKYNALLGK